MSPRLPPLHRRTLAASLALGVVLTARVWSAPLSQTIDTHFTDGHLLAAAVGGRGLWSGELFALHTDAAGWPAGVMFRPLLWPAVLLAGLVGPVLALNLTWALTPAANALGGLVLGRALRLSAAGSSALGLLLAWCSWSRVTLANGQIEQAFLGAIAAVWGAAIWAEDGPPWRVAAAPLLLLGLGLAAPNCGLSAALGLGLLAAARVLADRRRVWRHGAVLALCVLAALGVHAYHSPNYTLAPNFFRPRTRPPAGHDPSQFGIPSGWAADATHQLDQADLVSLLVPAGPGAFGGGVQHVPYLGGVVLLAALAAAIRAPRRALGMLAVGLGMAALAMGAETTVLGQRFLMPYALIDALAPSASASGSAYRLAMGAVVALSAAAAAGLDGLRLRGRAALGLVVLLAWVEATALPGKPLPYPARPAVEHPALASLAGGDGPVLDLPLPIRGPCTAVTAHHFNGHLAHRRPLLHTLSAGPNYFGQTETINQLHRLLRQPDCPEKVAGYLDALGVEAVILHTALPSCVAHDDLRLCMDAALGPATQAPDVYFWRREQEDHDE